MNTDIVELLQNKQPIADVAESPWRCDVTRNPVGTDTVMIGAPPCGCQGCRAHAIISSLRQEVADMEECGELAINALQLMRGNQALSDAQRAIIDEALEKYFSVRPVWRSFARALLPRE